MASIIVTGATIDIRFAWWERLWLGRGRLTVPVAAIRQAARVDRPLRLARGARSGLVVSGLIKIGVWGLFGCPRQLVAVRRGRPALHLVLDREAAGDDFDEILISDPAAQRLVESLNRAGSFGR